MKYNDIPAWVNDNYKKKQAVLEQTVLDEIGRTDGVPISAGEAAKTIASGLAIWAVIGLILAIWA